MVSGSFLSIYFVLILFGLSHQHYGVVGSRVLSQEEQDFDLELERQLKILNKPSVKTIQTNGGDTFDCVDIHKQPALDHPLLKNHKIQMKPGSRPKIMEAPSESKLSSSGSKPLGCPKGTVPIRRTGKDDLIREKSFFDSYRWTILTQANPGHHVAVRATADNGPYYGLTGFLNVASPKVENDQFSSTQLWVEGGPPNGITTLQAGWAVAPQLFGDSQTRIFVYSNSDLNRRGCYNLLCQGFVQIDGDTAIGDILDNISEYQGPQYIFSFTIYHDNATEAWWLAAGGFDGGTNIGYWPTKIYSALQYNASRVAWGGFVKGTPNGPSPPMGNGKFPHHRYKEACSIVRMQLVDWNRTFVNPDGPSYATIADSPDCYKAEYDGYIEGNGYSFLFGGTGGENCGV